MLKGSLRRFSLLVTFLFLWVWPVSGTWGGDETTPEMTASVVPNQTSVGGIITLTLKFQLPPGAQVTPEGELRGLEGFQVLERRLTMDGADKKDGDPKSPGMSVTGTYHLKLMVDRLDSGAVGPLLLSYVNPEGKKASLEASPVSLTVLSNLGDKPEAASLKPIYGIIPTGSFMVKYRFWILGGIALLLLGVACEWWFRKRRGKGEETIDETPADKVAIRGLKELEAQRLFEKGRIKDFYFGFSEILRRYLEAIRGFPAAEYTLEEIARAAKKKEDQPLLSLLRRADMIKFADGGATPAGKANDMEMAFAYIRSTREPQLTEAAAERRGGRNMTAQSARGKGFQS